MPRRKIAEADVIAAAAAPAEAKPKRVAKPKSTSVTHTHTTKKPAGKGMAAAASASAAPAPFTAPTHDEIAIRAYFHAESRGFQIGSPLDDWLRAEHELLAGQEKA